MNTFFGRGKCEPVGMNDDSSNLKRKIIRAPITTSSHRSPRRECNSQIFSCLNPEAAGKRGWIYFVGRRSAFHKEGGRQLNVQPPNCEAIINTAVLPMLKVIGDVGRGRQGNPHHLRPTRCDSTAAEHASLRRPANMIPTDSRPFPSNAFASGGRAQSFRHTIYELWNGEANLWEVRRTSLRPLETLPSMRRRRPPAFH